MSQSLVVSGRTVGVDVERQLRRLKKCQVIRPSQRGGTTGSGLAAERGTGVQRVEAVPVPAQARDGSHRQSPSCQKTVGSETFLPSAVVHRRVLFRSSRFHL